MIKTLEKRLQKLEMANITNPERLVIQGQGETTEEFEQRLLRLQLDDPRIVRLVIQA